MNRNRLVSLIVAVALFMENMDSTVIATFRFGGHGELTTADFQPAFLVVGLISASAALVFMRLHHDAGAELANRAPTSAVASDDRVG